MAIYKLHRADINYSQQWILVKGERVADPLIIHVQQGPGLPMISEANTMRKLLSLEDQYLIAYWDQRACGKSFDKNTDPKTINIYQMADDVIASTKYLLQQYKKEKAIIVGYSFGATASLAAAVKESRIFKQLFLVGTDIDVPAANRYAIQFALNKAQSMNNKKLVRQITDLSGTPITNAKMFHRRAKILTNMGGIKTGSNYNQLLISTIKNMLFTKSYRLKDISKSIKGIDFCQDAALPGLDTLDLFKRIKRVDTPIHFIHGKLDSVTPYEIATRYYEYIRADNKKFTAFEKSAHMPQYEEPDKFQKTLREAILK